MLSSFPVSTLKLISSKLDKSSELIHSIADLTIRGITKSTVITLRLNKNKENFTAVGSIDIDRTLYDIKYKSNKFYDNLGDKFIYDNFTIDFNLSTKNVAVDK